MTDSNIHPPQGSAQTEVDIKDPQPIPGTEVTEAPGLVPEEIDYLAPETTHPQGFYNPETANATEDPDGGVNTSHGYVPADTSGVGGYDADVQIGLDDAASTYEDPDEAHHQLMSDPHYAVHVHESQLNRIVEVLEEIASKLNDLEYRLESLEESVRFDKGQTDGPPEPPTGTDYSITGDIESYGGTAA